MTWATKEPTFRRYAVALFIFPVFWLLGQWVLFTFWERKLPGFEALISLPVEIAFGFCCYLVAVLASKHRCATCGRLRDVTTSGTCAKCEPRHRQSYLRLAFGIVQHALVALLILVVPFYFADFYWAFAEPVGINNDSGTGPCKVDEVSSMSNGHGLVVNVRSTTCMGDWDMVPSYFVFVHQSGESNSRNNLILRYDAGWQNHAPWWSLPPQAVWIAPNQVDVRSSGPMSEVTHQDSSIDGISITYELGPASCPSAVTPWRRMMFALYLWHSCKVST